MATCDAPRFTRVLLTGPPGIGKTTICKTLVSLLQKQNYMINGFYTEEVRDANKSRIGFDVVSLGNPDNRAPLARIPDASTRQCQKNRVGNYFVLTENFERIALPTLSTKRDFLFIDEIGKMELYSEKFIAIVNNLFFGKENKKVLIIATILEKHKIPQQHLSFFRQFHEDNLCKIIKVNRQNRDNLPEELFTLVSQISLSLKMSITE